MIKGQENLIPLNKRAKAEQREIQVMGGKKRGQDMKLLSTFKGIAQYVLKMKANDAAVDILAKRFPDIPKEEITNRMAIFLAQMAKAMSGDSAAYDRVQQTAGEKDPEASVVLQQTATSPENLKDNIKELKDLLKDI